MRIYTDGSFPESPSGATAESRQLRNGSPAHRQLRDGPTRTAPSTLVQRHAVSVDVTGGSLQIRSFPTAIRRSGLGLYPGVLIAPARVGNVGSVTRRAGGRQVLIAPARVGNAASRRCGRSRSSPHRPCEGWQQLLAPRGEGGPDRPHRPCEGWQHGGAVEQLGHRRVLIAPARVGNSLLTAPCPLGHGRSSSPLRGLATRRSQAHRLRRRVSSSPLRGLATRAARRSTVCRRRSSSPLRGLATESPVHDVGHPRRPHRPCEGWQLGMKPPPSPERAVLIAPARVGNSE